jgi:hypothetical protein
MMQFHNHNVPDFSGGNIPALRDDFSDTQGGLFKYDKSLTLLTNDGLFRQKSDFYDTWTGYF